MFFVVSKVFWGLAQPLSAALILIAIGVLLSWWRRPRLGGVAGLLGLLVLGLSGYTTVGALLIRPLENRFERPAWPEHIGAIVLLGGASDGAISAGRQVSELLEAGDRFTETLRLAQLYPEAKIVVSGGMGLLDYDGESEAATAQRFFTDLGIAQDRLILEDQARNTAENAEFTKSLLVGIDGPVVLVTSAFHMPRSMGLFAKAGMTVLPWPTDYRSTGREGLGVDVTDPSENLKTTTTAVREWIGLAVYHWTGQIDAMFPGPQGSN